MSDGFSPPKIHSDFKPAPAGTHIARVVWLINIGWQEVKWNNETKQLPKIIVGWELPNCKVEEGDHAGKPMIVTKFYTNSYAEQANLRKDLANWRGRDLTEKEISGDFSLTTIMDKPCQVTIVHKEANNKTYANVTAITALPQGMEAPARVHDLLMYSVDAHHEETFAKLPEWIQKKCHRQEAVTETENPAPPEYDDDIPF